MSRIEEAILKATQLRGVLHTETPPATTQPPRDRGYELPATKLQINNPLVVTANDVHSPVAEEFRKLKAYLVKTLREGRQCSSVMVTSSVGGEGKSLTSINLAVTLAEEYDHTVLLVDSDLRKPTLHSYFGLPQGPGLSDYLFGRVQLADVIVKTGVGKLSLLPAGAPVPNPAELFSSERMRDLAAELKRRYADRYVIFDSPPVLPLAETRILGHYVDGILFVIREGVTSKRQALEGLATLKSGHLLGVVYNSASLASIADRYGSGYGYASYGDRDESLHRGLFSFFGRKKAGVSGQ